MPGNSLPRDAVCASRRPKAVLCCHCYRKHASPVGRKTQRQRPESCALEVFAPTCHSFGIGIDIPQACCVVLGRSSAPAYLGEKMMQNTIRLCALRACTVPCRTLGNPDRRSTIAQYCPNYRDHVFAVRRKRRSRHRAGVSFESKEYLTVRRRCWIDVPQPRGIVLVRRNHSQTVRAKMKRKKYSSLPIPSV